MSHFALLPDRALLAISGEDARDFLQGLITKDMRKVVPGEAYFAVLLSPQGRFLFDFFITEHEGAFWLEMDKARLPDLMKRLTMYRLRAKVTIEALEMKVAAVWNNPSPRRGEVRRGASNSEIIANLAPTQPSPCGGGLNFAYADPRLAELGWRIIAKEIPAFAGMMESNYEAHRLSLGVPEGVKDLIVDRSILLEYGYDELNAIDFDKGCYVGQEVTARSKHRASLRKFIHQVKSDAPLPPKGTPVLAGDREAGVMCSSEGNVGLASCRVAEVEKAACAGIPLTAAGVALTAALPAWCRTVFQAD
jgi:folate-binding protein YgfZ